MGGLDKNLILLNTEICSKCKKEKPLEDFSFRKDTFKYRSVCKMCIADQREQYYKKNSVTVLKQKKEYYRENKEEILKKVKKRYEEVKNDENFKVAKRECGKKSYQKNKERKRTYERVRSHTDEQYNILKRLRRRLNRALKDYSIAGKCKKSDEYGIDYQTICKHLGSCPGNRENYHIDHIKPLSSFDFNDLEQIKEAFAPENHQWLMAEENLQKGNRF